MLYYVSGEVTILEPSLAVIDCGGVGYACATTNYTLAQLKKGERAKLYTYLHVREDIFEIYGFATQGELNSFKMLIGVSGVGPKAALAILSAATPDQLTLAVVSGDEKTLTAAPGIGKKIAQRIILELKDKIGGSVETPDFGSISAPAPISSGNLSLATAALQELGYSPAEVAQALKGADPAAPTEEIVRHALRAMMLK